MPEPAALPAPPPAVEAIAVLHVDDSLIIIDKPAGLLAVPGRREADCAWARVARELPDAMIVHRLDQATSGLMVLARGAAMQRALSIAFASQQVRKGYEAVVHGVAADHEGVIDAPLAADWPNRPRQRIDRHTGKPSRTHWRVLACDETTHHTRLWLEPQTGRSHQLRVHLASIGHAIVGDTLYGPADSAAEPRMLLHAAQLAFAHPLHGAPLSFTSPAPF
ncbi:MAG: RluA family pseudouridine synthase [Burkholderiaceae bacterium]